LYYIADIVVVNDIDNDEVVFWLCKKEKDPD